MTVHPFTRCTLMVRRFAADQSGPPRLYPFYEAGTPSAASAMYEQTVYETPIRSRQHREARGEDNEKMGD